MQYSVAVQTRRSSVSKVGLALWTVQGALALLFLFAGVMKLVLPIEAMTAEGMPQFPEAFLRFIGVCETLGALGLILPGLTRVRTELTPLAAAGLVVIMAGATMIGLGAGDLVGASIPLTVGLLAAFVAYGRTRLAPQRGPSWVPGFRSIS